MALIKFIVKLILSEIDQVWLLMFRTFDFVVDVNKDVVDKPIMNLLGYRKNARSIKFMNDIGAFVNLHDITKNS